MLLHLLSIVLILIYIFNLAICDKFKDNLLNAEKVANNVVTDIFARWQIDKFPNFLKSCSMPKQSWEFMKLKFKKRILAAEITKKPQNFSICFTGSSVTAGHDSPFNKSFAPLTGIIMSPVLEALNVHLVVRYAALGNNPCFPYDACVRTFCGSDADLIHWEQSYFCGWYGEQKPTLEQFIRQSIVSPSHPIVIFSNSDTDNWHEKDCPNPIVPHIVTTEEKDMLRASAQTIATEINKDQYRIPQEITKGYPIAGLQYWFHSHYRQYKCQGPYHKDWGVVALKHMESIISSHPMPVRPIYPSNVSDHIQCLTDYEPRIDRMAGIRSHIISGLKIGNATGGWSVSILEHLLAKDYKRRIASKHEAARYVDYKHIYIANHDSGPLSIRIQPTVKDVISIEMLLYFQVIEKVRYFGRPAGGANHIWEVNPMVYVTLNVHDTTIFVFDV
eukprot:gene9612-19977_t